MALARPLSIDTFGPASQEDEDNLRFFGVARNLEHPPHRPGRLSQLCSVLLQMSEWICLLLVRPSHHLWWLRWNDLQHCRQSKRHLW